MSPGNALIKRKENMEAININIIAEIKRRNKNLITIHLYIIKFGLILYKGLPNCFKK